MSKKKRPSGKIVNRRARYDYQLGDELVVGIALSGAETRALRQGHADLSGAYVTLKGGELWLTNARVFGSGSAPIAEDSQSRSRKLLAKSSEIQRLAENRQGNTIVPLEFLTEGRFIKLRIAPGRGKKRYDKRETIKRRDQQREIERQARG